MDNSYLDTVAAYHDYPKGCIQLSSDTYWNKTVEKMGHTEVKSYWTRDNGVTVRAYNNIFGTGRVFMSTSIPKLVHGNNYWYADLSDIPVVVNTLERTLSKHIQTPAAIDPLSFQLSRVDTFYMHEIPPELKPYVMDALQKVGATGRFNPSRIKNTRYISVKLIGDVDNDGNFRPSSVVVRVYDKCLEVYNRYYTEDADRDFHHHRYTEWIPPNYVRVELSLRRDAIVNKLGDRNQPRHTDPGTTLGALLLNPQRQAELLDNHFRRMGFYERVYSAPTFRDEAEAITRPPRKTKTYDNIIEAARLYRNDKNPGISRDAHELLRDNGISLVTTGENGHDLPPIDREALLARNAVYKDLR
jgi:hypothetical protein